MKRRRVEGVTLTGQNQKRCSSQEAALARVYEGSHDHQCPDAVNRCGRAMVPWKLCGDEPGPKLDSAFTSIKASESRLTSSASSAMDYDNHEEVLIG
jgi:hypothetical protein